MGSELPCSGISAEGTGTSHGVKRGLGMPLEQNRGSWSSLSTDLAGESSYLIKKEGYEADVQRTGPQWDPYEGDDRPVGWGGT